MAKYIMSVLLALIAATQVQAQTVNLRGQWQVTVLTQPDYLGALLIDAEYRAAWDAPKDGGRPAKFHGYVAKVDDTRAEFVFTNRTVVVRTTCTILSSDLLHCSNFHRDDGRVSPQFVLTRIGAGPQKLISSLP